LAATGRDGLRAAARLLVAGAPEQFAAEVDAPAAVHVLQNNWFRLLGSGGALSFDARGLARFDESSITISKSFCSTRLFGGRPDGTELRAERVDLAAAGHRSEGGYGEVCRIPVGGKLDQRLPALVAGDQTPPRPSAVAFDWQPTTGYHELRLTLRSDRGASLVGVWLDEVLLRCITC